MSKLVSLSFAKIQTKEVLKKKKEKENPKQPIACRLRGEVSALELFLWTYSKPVRKLLIMETQKHTITRLTIV